MLDYNWLNADSRTFLSRGYLKEGVSAEERIRKIAEKAESILKIDGFADKFELYMSRGWYSLATPVWCNFGEPNGLPISCNGQYVDDSMDDILHCNAETGMMTKHGAGTSAYFGGLRPRGSNISMGGKSFGAVHFMQMFEKTTQIVSQSNIRRGSFAAYYPVEGDDIEEFLEVREDGNPIQDISIGVCITDAWMNEMRSGDKKKEKIWRRIIKKRFESGYPYIFWTDTVNNNKPLVYKDKNMQVHASNLCVTGDQRVVSNYGLLTAEELYEIEGPLTLFDGVKPVQSSGMELIDSNADVYKVTLENGLTHTITDYHKVVVRNGDRHIGDRDYPVIYKECKELNIGDYVGIQLNKGLFGNLDMPEEAYLLGLYHADGTQHKNSIHICVWENDFDLIPEIERCYDVIHDKYEKQYLRQRATPYNKPVFRSNNTGQSLIQKKTLQSKLLHNALNFQKNIIPDWIWSANENTQWKYIKGLFEADGTVNINNSEGNPFHLSLSSVNQEFLQDVQIILLNLGVRSSLSLMRAEGKTLLPDQKGGYKLYSTQNCYRLVCGSKNDGIIFDQNTGFISRKGFKLESGYRDNSKKFSKVKSIEYSGKQPVYCVKVDTNEHIWVCNGFLTHNCSEIALSSDIDESFVCDLSSMNLLYYEDWKDTDAVEILTFLLDAVMTEYIEKTKDMPFMQKAHNFAKNQRALGVGGLGWHSFLQSKMIPFESMEAKLYNTKIWKFIEERTKKASREMATLYGEPKLLKGYGYRNVCLQAIAPTTSSAFILGQVSPSIEPLNSNYFVKDVAKGKFTYKNPYLKETLKSHKKDNKETWESILVHGGSVQHLDFLTEKEKYVFKTFGEISQKEIIIQAAARQKYIDQAQSINLMIHPGASLKEVNELMIFAWESGIKTLYYQRGTNPAQELARNLINHCVSCEA